MGLRAPPAGATPNAEGATGAGAPKPKLLPAVGTKSDVPAGAAKGAPAAGATAAAPPPLNRPPPTAGAAAGADAAAAPPPNRRPPEEEKAAGIGAGAAPGTAAAGCGVAAAAPNKDCGVADVVGVAVPEARLLKSPPGAAGVRSRPKAGNAGAATPVGIPLRFAL